MSNRTTNRQADAGIVKDPSASAFTPIERRPPPAEIDRIRQAVEAEVRQLERLLDTEHLEPVRSTLREVAESHRALEQALARDEGATRAGVDRWRLICEYRNRVAEHVLTPLRDQIGEPFLGEALGDAFLRAIRSLARHAEGWDVERTVPEDPALFAPQAGDSVLRRSRKAVARSRRGLARARVGVDNRLRRLIRRPPREQPERQRTVPLRTLLDYHLQVRVAQQLMRQHEAVQQQLGCVIGPLEAALTTWSNGVFRAEFESETRHVHEPSWAVHLKHREEASGESEIQNASEISSLAVAFQEALTTAAAADLTPPPLEKGILEEMSRELTTDVERAGTFLLEMKNRRLPTRGTPSSRIDARRAQWANWHRQAFNRFALAVRLVELRNRLMSLEDGLLERLGSATVRPIVEALRGLSDDLNVKHRLVIDVCQKTSPATAKVLRDELGRIQASILEQLTTTLRDLPAAVASREALADPARSEWEQLVELMKDLPDRVSVHLWEPKTDQPIDPRAGVLALDLREIAEDAMDPPWPEQLQEHTKPLQLRVVQVWSGAEQVRDIIQYNLGSVVDELENAIASGPDPKALAAAIETARQLAPDGVRRSVVTLNELVQSLREPWYALCDRAFSAIHEDWEDLLKRVRADQVLRARWVQVQTRVARLIEHLLRRLHHWIKRAIARVGGWVGIVHRRAMQLVRRGQSAIGVSEPDETEPAHALDAIVGIGEVLATRPLVYRRLFSFTPVKDPSLLDGRARDLVRVRKHFVAWRDAQAPGVIILPAPLGSGRTSFLNAVGSKVLEDCAVHTVSLTSRVSEPSAFAAVLAGALGIQGEAAKSLDHLEAHLVSRVRTTPPTACMIDNLEHVLLQAPGGTALLQRVLVFFSRTDSTVYWIATIARPAWHFFTKTGGTAAQLVTEYPLERLDRDVLRDIVNNRHGRTGLPLRFAIPSDLSPFLRHRLRRARMESKKQVLLRDWYFENLHRESGEDIMLALFYWLRSADFGTAEDTLTIKPLEALSFRFLGAFDLPRTFTLKAFVVHNTLSLDEHARIFRLNEEQSTIQLESLLTLRLIEPVNLAGEPDDQPAHSRVVPGQRYRLRRLILHPVIQHLQDRNLLT